MSAANDLTSRVEDRPRTYSRSQGKAKDLSPEAKARPRTLSYEAKKRP